MLSEVRAVYVFCGQIKYITKMVSIQVKFRPSALADREGTIYYQLIHERTVRQLTTVYKIFSYEWDDKRSMVRTVPNSGRESLLLTIRERIRGDLERLTKLERKLASAGVPYSADEIIDEYHRYAQAYSLFNFMESVIARLKQNGRTRTSETYKSVLNSFRKYRNDEDIMLDSITPELMEGYESWHRKRGVTPNTISFYTRILRAVYNRAVEGNIIENRHPFRHVYTGVDKTMKRALPLEVIRKIKALDLSDIPAIEFARDMFLMSFYLRGMSFIDMALYVARHSWASAAKAKGIPLSAISEGMGHDSEATTRIYLASLDTSVVDKANSLIIRSLK